MRYLILPPKCIVCIKANAAVDLRKEQLLLNVVNDSGLLVASVKVFSDSADRF